MKNYMIIEKFHAGKIAILYQRFAEKGRMLPEGVHYVNSWIDENLTCCFQLMQSESLEALQQWIAQWEDLTDFEIFPVIDSAQAKKNGNSSKMIVLSTSQTIKPSFHKK